MREQSLPGVGQRFEIDVAADGRHLVIIATRDGGRVVALARDDAAEPSASISLSADEAVLAGALLLGARFTIDRADAADLADDPVIVDTVTVPAGAPSVGVRPSEVVAPLGSETTVLAVIRDHTSELVEGEADPPLQPGDRVVVAARRRTLGEATRLITG